MANEGETIEIGAFKSRRKVGDQVEITQGTGPGIVNVGTVLKVITAGGVVVALLVKILA